MLVPRPVVTAAIGRVRRIAADRRDVEMARRRS